MTVDLSKLQGKHRLLFAIPLEPLQGKRFQPTGFPGLGAATFQTKEGQCLLVESAQSTANRLEKVVWDERTNDVASDLAGLSHVRIVRGKGKTKVEREKDKDKAFLTDTILESHRLNSPYLLENSHRTFFDTLKTDLGGLEAGPIDRKQLAETLLKYDVGSLLHGLFLAKKELAGGRLRVARALSAFIEADGVRIAPSGGVKNDHVNPSGDTKQGFGNVPFARDEFSAECTTLYVNLDLAQIRGYRLGDEVERLLVLLGLWKLRALLEAGLRLRTACDFQVKPGSGEIASTNIPDFSLPNLAAITPALKEVIAKTKDRMSVQVIAYDDDLKKKGDSAEDAETTTEEEDGE